MAILTPKLPADERWQTIGSVKRVQRRLLLAIAVPLIPLPLLAYVSGILDGLLAPVMVAGIFAVWAALRREYLRSVLLMYFRPHTLLATDAVYAVTLLAGVAAAIFDWQGHRHRCDNARWSLPTGRVRPRRIDQLLKIRAGRTGTGSNHLAGDSQPWILVRRWAQPSGGFSARATAFCWQLGLDLTAVADVNATRLLLMPAIVLAIGVGSLLSPTAASWYAQIGIHRLVRRLLMLLLVVGLIETTYFRYRMDGPGLVGRWHPT